MALEDLLRGARRASIEASNRARAQTGDAPMPMPTEVAPSLTMEDLSRMMQSGEIDPLSAMSGAMQLQGQRNSAAQAGAAERNSLEAAQLSAMSPEERAAYQQNQARDQRYGNDMAWLDPSFQYDPSLLGTAAASQAFADPAAVDAQRRTLAGFEGLAGPAGNAAQQGLSSEWAAVQAGQGAPTFRGDVDQRAVLNAALGYTTNTGPGSLQFDSGARQGEQYGNLQGIIAGGGATAIEMADRARQRADSEAWLRGQREADMADYAERGMTGSGMELMALSADRQSAAGRNSLADLEMAKALEQRRMDAINSAAGLATNMRGQTIDEQGLLNSRATSGLGAASSVANAMRGADYNERTYLDERMLDALGQRTDLAETMRNQSLDAWQSAGDLSTTMRDASFDEAYKRGGAADEFSRFNQEAINNARQTGTQFLQNAYTNMMSARQQWDINNLNNNIGIAEGQRNFDQRENTAASRQADNIAGYDADAFNRALEQFRSTMTGAGNAATERDYDVAREGNQLGQQAGQFGGAAGDAIITYGTSAMGGNNGGSLSKAGTTWAQNGSGGAPAWDPADESTWNYNR